VGDFNGDGYQDIALRDPSSGNLTYLKPNFVGDLAVGSVISTSTAYVPVSVADFNGDGRSDVAFRNVDTGDLGYMSFNPGSGQTWHPMGSTSTDYFALYEAASAGMGGRRRRRPKPAQA
jgi:hypothetical protein